MARTVCEYGLERALAYLRWSGVTLTPAVTQAALQIVQEAIAEGETDLFARIMARLPERFELPRADRVQAAPPIHRDSIGYHC